MTCQAGTRWPATVALDVELPARDAARWDTALWDTARWDVEARGGGWVALGDVVECTVTGGRPNPRAGPDVATLTATVLDTAGRWSPLAPAADLVDLALPVRFTVQVPGSALADVLFVGVAVASTWSATPGQVAVLAVECVDDASHRLATLTRPVGTAVGVNEFVAARVTRLLDLAGWPRSRMDLAPLTSPRFVATTLDRSRWAELVDTAHAARADLWCSTAGVVILDRIDETPSIIGPDLTDGTGLDDLAADAVCLVELVAVVDDAALVNIATATRPGNAVPVTVTGPGATTAPRSAVAELPVTADDGVTAWCEWRLLAAQPGPPVEVTAASEADPAAWQLVRVDPRLRSRLRWDGRTAEHSLLSWELRVDAVDGLTARWSLWPVETWEG